MTISTDGPAAPGVAVGPVRYCENDGAAVLTLDRPDQLNGLNGALLEALLEELEAIATRKSVRVVVLTGAGRAFCAGGDLNDTHSVVGTGTTEDKARRLRRFGRISELLRHMPQVTIAAVNGPCAGAGMAIACAADFRYASGRAVFNTAALTVGVSGDFGGSWLLPRIVGTSRAYELFMMTPRVDAGAALDMGLVSAVFAPEEFENRVAAIAATLASRAPAALAAMKANFIDAAGLTLGATLDREAQRHAECMATNDFREALDAYLHKREPRFTGS